MDEKKEVVVELDTIQITYADTRHKPLILPNLFNQMSKYNTFVFYCHTPQASPIHDANFANFYKNVLPSLAASKEIFTCVILNEHESFDFTTSNTNVSLLDQPNVVGIHRPNIGFDFGGFADALACTGIMRLQTPFYFIGMNDTVYGPLFPWWLDTKPNWITIFKKMIIGDVKLAGMTINPYMGRPHVQSMLFITDEIGLKIGVDAQVFVAHYDKHDAIQKSEVEFSRAILARGFNIDCTATLLHGIDYRNPKEIPTHLQDVCYVGQYATDTLHPFDAIFLKTTRYGMNTCQQLQPSQASLKNVAS